MKRLITLIVLLLAIPCFAQNQYEILFQSESEETIQLSVIVYDVKEKYADSYANLYAIQTLIFDGVKGSRRRYLPFVQDEKNSIEEHGGYYHNLFDKGGYWSFVIGSAIVEKGKTPDKKKYFMVNVNINYKALKESLASHNVIRRFGV